MDLAYKIVTKDILELDKKGVRILWLGSEDRVGEKLKQAIRDAEERTKNNTNGTLCLCFNYGGQREIAAAVQKIVASGVVASEVTEEMIAEHLYYPEVPPVDLVIRTSGEQRLSNFMLWRAAYAELYFIQKHWPDFSADDLDEALQAYENRGRRFGG